GGKGGPCGAAVVKNSEILSMASNEVLVSNDPTAHAEIVAIRRACQKLHTYDLSGCTLYSTGEPCPMCLSAIVWANIKKVYYACPASDAAKIGFRDSMIYSHIRGEEQVLEIEKLDCEAASLLYEEYQTMGSVIY
ncbi:MAG: nucleoside deaminase, partial [Bacillota bacterium]